MGFANTNRTKARFGREFKRPNETANVCALNVDKAHMPRKGTVVVGYLQIKKHIRL